MSLKKPNSRPKKAKIGKKQVETGSIKAEMAQAESLDKDGVPLRLSAKETAKRTKAIRPKEKAVLEATIGGKSPVEAVKQAGMQMSRAAADKYVENIRRKYMDANGLLLVALENVGVSLETVAEKVSEGLNASATVKSGKKVVEVPDFRTRHKYLETALDIMGGRAPTKSIVETIKTHEQTVAIVKEINNSDVAMRILQQRLEERNRVQISTARRVQENEIEIPKGDFSVLDENGQETIDENEGQQERNGIENDD